jgi:hypothetical protein
MVTYSKKGSGVKIPGHVPALMYWSACSIVQIPGADVVVGITGLLVIKPPG